MELSIEKTYVVLDIETTGKRIPDGKIIEIAGIKISGGQPVDIFHTLVNPKERLPWFITKLTGINDRMLRNAPTFEDISAALAQFIFGTSLVAHNANFDIPFIKHSLETSLAHYLFDNEHLCTIKLAKKKFPDLGRYNLDFLTETFQLNNPQRHRAFGDASATAEFFIKYLLVREVRPPCISNDAIN